MTRRIGWRKDRAVSRGLEEVFVTLPKGDDSDGLAWSVDGIYTKKGRIKDCTVGMTLC